MAQGNEFGCDIDQMSQLSDTFKSAHDQIASLVEDLKSKYMGLPWEGPDSEEFKNQVVANQLTNCLGNVSECLESKRQKVNENKDRQIQVSSAA